MPNNLGLHIAIPWNSSTSKIGLPSSLRLVRVVSGELSELLTSILEVFERLPARAYLVVSGPVTKVFYLPVTLLSVKNPFDLPILQVIEN